MELPLEPAPDAPTSDPSFIPEGLVYDDARDAVPEAFPHVGTPEEQLYFMLNWAVRAPSVLNTQPWLFAVDEHLVRLYPDRARQLLALDPAGRELAISCGAALAVLGVAARRFGYQTESHLQPIAEHPEVFGALLLTRPDEPTDEDRALFDAIDVRHTERAAFDDAPLPSAMIDTLVAAAAAEGIRLHVVTEPGPKEDLADLVARGLLAQSEDARITEEIRAWLRLDGAPQRDGVPARVKTPWDRHAAFRTPVPELAEYRRKLVAEAPALLVLATDTDDTIAWLQTGRALGRLLLVAATDGAAVSYINQPVEVDALRTELGQRIGEEYPQLVLRIGHSGGREPTPRRPVRDLLLKPITQEWHWSPPST